PMRPRAIIAGILLLLGHCVLSAGAVERTDRELERRFADTVHPFLETYCLACHGEEKQKGKLDLRPYSTMAAVAAGYRQWEVVTHKLPDEAEPPAAAQP